MKNKGRRKKEPTWEYSFIIIQEEKILCVSPWPANIYENDTNGTNVHRIKNK